MDKYELVDVRREVYPEKRGYTWRKFNIAQQGRLDCFLFSEEMMPGVNSVKINPALVYLELKTEGRKYGKQYWKFNNSLLEVKTYIFMIKQLILNIKKQYAVPVYNLDNIKHIPDELIEFQINDQLFFFKTNLVLINRRNGPRYQRFLALCAFINRGNTEGTNSSKILCSMFVYV